MVAVTGRTCYDRIRIFEVKRYFLIDITESRGQIIEAVLKPLTVQVSSMVSGFLLQI